MSTGTAGTGADAPGSALFAEVGRCPGCAMAADARVLLARAQTQTLQPFPPLSTIDRFENGGLPVQLVLYQQTLVLYRIFTKTLREECIQYSVFSNCSSTVTVSPSGPPGLFKGVTTAMSGVLARFPWLLPVRNPVAGYGASAVTRTSGRGHVAEA